MADARSHREPAAYVQTILRHAKSANIESVENQLTFAYQNITTDLRAFIDPPTGTTTVSQFIQTLEHKKDTWWDMHRHDGQRMGGQRDRDRDNRSPRFEGRNSQYGNFRPNRNFSSQFPSQAQYQSPYRQPSFPTSDRPGQTAYQGFPSFVPRTMPLTQNQQSSSFQRTPMVPPQAGYTPRQPLQPTSGNGPQNPYRGPPNQQRTGQPPYNQRNEGGYRPNYPQPVKAYHGELTNQFS